MREFSIEAAAEQIHDSRSREYFREVLSSYNNENYRSAVVMLWSVVVCDLIYKLKSLETIYADPIATAILGDVKNRRAGNPNSPEWEEYLVKQIKDRTDLLDVVENYNVMAIQQVRHLSAHPIIGQEDLLISPTRDTVRAHIRNGLENVLLKPPILSRKVVEVLVNDLADNRDVLMDKRSLHRYIESKYFKSMRTSARIMVFKDLWKFVFRLSNDKADENREINFRTLCAIYENNAEDVKECIKNNKDYFSMVDNRETLGFLIHFLSYDKLVYTLLNEAAHTIISKYAQDNISAYSLAFFLSESVSEHIEKLTSRIRKQNSFFDKDSIDTKAYERFLDIADQYSVQEQALPVGIEIYVRSGDFAAADTFFARYIDPYIQLLNLDHLQLLVQGCESNSQTYSRRNAVHDHAKIRDRILNVMPPESDLLKSKVLVRQ